MKLADLAGRSIGLLGLGTDNRALLPHLAQLDPRPTLAAYEDAPEGLSDDLLARLDAAGCALRPMAELGADNPDIVVRSPGFPRYRDDLNPFRSAERMTTPTALWLESHGEGHTTILVTGTKGKSGTSAAIAALTADARPLLVGNIGVPVWSVEPGELDDERVIVCEVSSYQASDTRYAATAGVLTNLDADHISWHGSVERYHADKLQAVQFADHLFCAGDNQPAVDAIGALRPDSSSVVTVADTLEGRDASVTDFFASLPTHVASNLALALATTEHVLGGRLADAEIIARLIALPALPGRLRELGTLGQVTVVDDSLASNPMGAAAGITTYRDTQHLWLIVGGSDRDVPIDPVVDAIAERAAGTVSVIGLPDNGPAICAALDQLPQVTSTTQVGAVEDAIELIDQDQPGVLLFSPAAPTPNRFGTWKDRTAALEAAFDAYRTTP